MKKITTFAFAITLLFASCQKDAKKKQESLAMGDLTISKTQPMPGDKIDVNYKTDKDVEAFYEYMVGDESYPVDMDFSKANTEQKASIKIPDSAVALAFILKSDDTYDANDEKGYLLPLYNEEGKTVVGSQSAIAFYKLRFGENYGIKADAKEVTQSIKSDLDQHPELKEDWDDSYLGLLYRNDKTEGKKEIDSHLASLSEKANKSETDYSSMMNFYRMTDQQAQSDSIKAIVLEKFPKGQTATMDMVNGFGQEESLEKKVQMFDNYKASHDKLGNLGNYMASNLANAYFKKNDMENFEKYSSMIDDKARRASSLNNIAWGMAEKGEDLDHAEKMSKTSLDLITSVQKSPEDKPNYLTKNQYKKQLESSYSMFADTYALVLFKQGNVKDAISYQEKAHDPKNRDVEANQRYIEYLMADKQYKKVKTKAETFIKSGHGNSKIKEDFKTAYQNVDPSAKDIDQKLETLEKEAYNTQVAEIEKTMLDEEAPKFTLKDSKGKDISLEALKGKTVILDFWATWCGPCKASFPGMQQVVTKYKDNENVVLLFVDTFERGADREKKVEDFIKENNYDFHVVYDTMIEGSNNFEVADKYGITGIPTKVVIGPDGKMKFKAVGFMGSSEKLASEMDIMIDILKS